METIGTDSQEGTLLSASHIDVTDPCHVPQRCQAVNDILARVGDKWSMQVVMGLAAGPLRFNALRRSIDGISQRMLTRTLRGLERDGLVSRTVTPSVPPRVDYELTALGKSLRAPVIALGDWVMNHREIIETARTSFDEENGGDF